ncbi:hypothetical protein KA012_01275 [Candidatus Woesebacteria bacterium]|nr:hypothetical protein [Candidatus Woesebacteria bacterium]
MPMHQIDLNEEVKTSVDQPIHPDQPRVDDPMLSSHNQPAARTANQARETQKPMKKSAQKNALLVVALTVLFGVATGYLLNMQFPSGSLPGESATPVAQVATGTVSVGDIFGAADPAAFKDSVSGYLDVGGVGGEGSHSLHRPGGASQTVTLTSSITDLSKFEGMEVKIWGETFRGQKAGWLMDVGRIEILNTKGEKPE